MHAGPFYITPAFTVRELGVDTNVFNEVDDPKLDFTFTVVPRVEVAVPVGHRLLLKTTSGAELVYYKEYSSERSVNPRFGALVELYLNRITLFAEPTFVRTRQRPNFEIDARSLRTENAFSGGVRLHYSPKLSFEVGVRQTVLDYAGDEVYNNVRLQETLNRESTAVFSAVRHALTPLTTLILKGERTEERFEFSPDRDSDTLRITPGVEFKPHALISGTAYVGVRRFETTSEALEDFNGLVAAATLSYTLLGQTAFIFSADRDVTYSYERFQPYFVVDGYGVTVRHRLPGRFDVMVGGQRHKYSYRDLFVPRAPELGEDRVDTTRNFSGSIGYNLGTDTRIGFGVSHWRRQSNSGRFRDYDGLRIGTTITYGF